MAEDTFAAFSPKAPATGTPDGRFSQVRQGWLNFIQKPENRAGLLQFGVNLMQPIAPGQSFGGHVAQSAAAGVGARDRQLAGRMEQEVQQQNLALDRQALDIQRGQLDTNRLNAEANYLNATRATRNQDRLELVTWLLETAPYSGEEWMEELVRMLTQPATPEERAEGERRLNELLQIVSGVPQGDVIPGDRGPSPGATQPQSGAGGSPAGGPAQGPSAAPAGPSGGDISAQLNAAFPNAPAGTRRLDTMTNTIYVKQVDGTWRPQ